MNMKSLRLVVKILSLMLVMAGFSYQAILIFIDYFEYTTRTHISILEVLSETTVPSIVSCFYHYPRYVNQSIHELFNGDLQDNITIEWSKVRNSCKSDEIVNEGTKITRLFGSHNLYCLSIGYDRKWTLNSHSLQSCPYKWISRISFTGTFTSKKLQFSKRFNSNGFLTVTFIQDHDWDIDRPVKTPVVDYLTGDVDIFIAGLTYSISLTKFLPPPYETKCRDYRQSGFRSKYNCLAECMRRKTIKRNFLIDSFWIDFERFKDSSKNISIVPYLMGSQSNRQLRENIKYWLTSPKKMWKANTRLNLSDQEIADILDKVTFAYEVEKSCNQSCLQDDCETQVLTSYAMVTHKQVAGQFKQSLYRLLGVLSSNQVVHILDTKAKLSFLDFFVYITSCMSFWFGFCPLAIVREIDVKLTKVKDKRDRQKVSRTRSREVKEQNRLH